MRMRRLHDCPTERISSRVLYGLTGLAAVVFALFYLVGFYMPYLPDPSFNAPIFTDGVIFLMIALLLMAVSVAVAAVVKTLRKTGKGEAISNRIPVRKISMAVVIVTIGLLLLTFLLGSTGALPVNGNDFTDALWLRTADMFINTSLVLIVIAIIAVLYGATRYYRKERR